MNISNASTSFLPPHFDCENGLLLQCWYSDGSPFIIVYHGTIYFASLLYLFIGMAIISDHLMGSIEAITSRKRFEANRGKRWKEVKRSDLPAHLLNAFLRALLMKLSSSAIEIIFSIVTFGVDLYVEDTESDELGPIVIIGSAAFDMFISTALCIWTVPSETVKRIGKLRVFLVNFTCTICAYAWIFTILLVSSPGMIEVWEGGVAAGIYAIHIALTYYVGQKEAIKVVNAPVAEEESSLSSSSSSSQSSSVEDLRTAKTRQVEIAVPKKSHAYYRMMAAQRYYGGHRVRQSGSSSGVQTRLECPEKATVAEKSALKSRAAEHSQKTKIKSNRIWKCTRGWTKQLREAFIVHPLNISSSLDDDPLEQQPNQPTKFSKIDYIFHYLTLFWRLLFAAVPPPTVAHGWPAFTVSITIMSFLTIIIYDAAEHFGATIYLKNPVTAIVLVATLGTSIQDTFANKIAARKEDKADSSIGYIPDGSAAFLGIVLPWTVVAMYYKLRGNGNGFAINPGSLPFSMVVFSIGATIVVIVLMLRRVYLKGELGGRKCWKRRTVVLFFTLWGIFVFLVTLETYGLIVPWDS